MPEVRHAPPPAQSLLHPPGWKVLRHPARLLARAGEPLAVDNFVARKKAGERIAGLRDFPAEVIAKGGFTNVSNQAMQIRLVALKLVTDASNPQRSLL